jgi:hypothetical protein
MDFFDIYATIILGMVATGAREIHGHYDNAFFVTFVQVY